MAVYLIENLLEKIHDKLNKWFAEHPTVESDYLSNGIAVYCNSNRNLISLYKYCQENDLKVSMQDGIAVVSVYSEISNNPSPLPKSNLVQRPVFKSTTLKQFQENGKYAGCNGKYWIILWENRQSAPYGARGYITSVHNNDIKVFNTFDDANATVRRLKPGWTVAEVSINDGVIKF